ncbi:sulfite exporter TauE/SafE family protein [Amycolatopsis jiangsuensis]|uniref:Probable membrane transporter protein n=1 Tax=Amycolatopsis jiangsuensis TaxID=1181879 RepID=A0A840IVB1_9PSEU|nr:sulfite exporter TauE/SafE family protein [Amycolatopsis jiangsuensis]MBB4685810.1 putative membrane protein YfcA [Amycolatopsis jiangsuensis]
MFPSILVLFLFGCLSGVTTVLFGFGGGFVTVPVVAAVTRSGDAMHVAVATSTAVMVVNSVTATIVQARAGRLRREYVWPLAAFIAAGAVAGSVLATRIGDGVLRVLFVGYLALTIVDSVLRGGFLRAHGEPRPLGPVTTTVGGIGIGAVASFLGVGGSVLTVPLLRRKGLAMAGATAMANPLSVPVAVIGTAVYATAGSGPAGYLDPVAAAALLAGSLPAIAVLRRVADRLPDRGHAIAYVLLLAAALLAVAFGG